MAEKKRSKKVHDLAKELGVDSKAIVAKCIAEGLQGIATHNSPVSLGQEMTIREYFSESHQTVTSVETTAVVDVAKARKSVKPRKKLGGEPDADKSASGAAGTATEEPPATSPAAPAPPPVSEPEPSVSVTPPPAAPAVVVAPVATPVVTTPPAPPAAPSAPEARATPAAPPPARPAPAHARPAPARPAAATPPAAPPPAATPARVIVPAGKPNVPTRPTIVKPMGTTLNKPEQAVLRGPKVVRIDKPETMAPPRPRRPMGPGGGGPSGGGPAGAGSTSDSGIARSRGPVRGRGAGAPPPGGVTEDGGKTPAGKRRSLSSRRGRSADALPTGPTKFSEQDIAELDSKLHHATGFIKQRRRTLTKSPGAGGQAQSAAVVGGKVEVSEPITIKSLSAATGLKSTDIIKYLFKKGVMATINSAIDANMAMEIGLENNIEIEVKEQQTAEQVVVADFETREVTDQRPRPPIVTVLGHVDHGKTSLLDKIRAADVAAHEAGGITQHVGAYRVTIKGSDGKDKTVVFLDTPGHEAFTTMRARGAKITDLVVLVVAADDGVMPQTIESINHAKAANVPIIVALNKIDKAEATEANVRKIFGQLAEHGLNPTEWGGTTEVVRVSATQGTGVTDLLEILDYQAELLQLKADYGGTARGTVIEAQMVPGRGPVARILVQQGQMRVGQFIVIGRAFGRVRDMTDEYGKHVTDAGPATPLEISGIDLIPDAGDKFYVTTTLAKAEEIAIHYRETERQKQLAAQTKVTLDNFAEKVKSGGTRELRLVLKADVQGSIKPLIDSLGELGNEEVGVRVLHSAVGGITESDVLLAEASDAVIVGFHVVAPPAVRDIAEARGVDIRLYRIIYEVTDDIKKALEGMLEPEKREEEIGSADVREVFRISKVGAVAGCLVTSGMMQRSGKVRVVRDNVVVTENRNMESLRRVKQDAAEVRAGTECGIRIAGFDDLKPGDKIICYSVQSIARKLA